MNLSCSCSCRERIALTGGRKSTLLRAAHAASDGYAAAFAKAAQAERDAAAAATAATARTARRNGSTTRCSSVGSDSSAGAAAAAVGSSASSIDVDGAAAEFRADLPVVGLDVLLGLAMATWRAQVAADRAGTAALFAAYAASSGGGANAAQTASGTLTPVVMDLEVSSLLGEGLTEVMSRR